MIHTSFTLPHVEDKACRMVWVAVLFAIIRDLCASDGRSRDRDDTERWVGDWPDRDFRTVCTLAGLDPEWAHRTLFSLMQRPPAERRKTVSARLGCKQDHVANALMMRQMAPGITRQGTETAHREAHREAHAHVQVSLPTCTPPTPPVQQPGRCAR